MRRLYLHIYAAFLVVLALSVGAAAGVAHLSGDTGRGAVPQPARAAAEWLAETLPPDPAAQQAAIEEASHKLGISLILLDFNGARLAGSLPVADPPDHEGWFGSRQVHGLAVRLADGRLLAGTLPNSGAPNWWLGFLALFFVMALGSLPVARRITWRLERMKRAAERWGQGDLSVRVPVHGHDELADLATTFNRAAARVEALVATQRRVLAHASHELRSPLARLRMALAILDDEDPDRHELAEAAGRDIEELDALIGDLLLAERLNAGQDLLPDHSRDVDVDLRALLDDEAARTGASVEGPSLTVRGDPALLRRMLRNLLENARRYGGGQPIEARVEAGPAVLVADRGPGVPAEATDKIWEPFYRAPGHRETQDGGIGLGLSLVRQIARHHGAEASHRTRDGGGTVFEVRWPPAT